MNITIQSIVNAKIKQTRKIPFQAIRASITRMRLEDDRILLNKIKPLKSLNVNEVSFNMIYCHVGYFIMGSDNEKDNNPKRIERIEHPFFLGETEVTQELYQAVMGYNPSKFKDDGKNPVEQVTWYDSILFCNKLSRMLGKTPYYLISNINYYNNSQNIQSADVEINPNANGFRLPTEKEWEYASKAGTENKYSGCDSNGDIKKYAWFNGNSDKKTHPVKTKLPNEWGFYDMSGNVDELCWDKYESSYPYRVTRGGSWPFDALYLHSACRSYSTGRRDDIGFRVSSFL